ncbi:MAG: hypothetical protein C0196_01370 [Dictyoglomus turgidum]|nr:MAG: hypothetical protein C0196_01370 [Dictyoglomus turgidum]
MKISVCIITKNAGADLCRCIESVKRFAYEIIVVDTGSNDATTEIAKKLGAKVYIYPEQIFDFSAFRNFALEHAEGDYILSIDSDEAFCIHNESVLLELLEKERGLGYALLVQNYFPNGRWGCYPVTKLFKNDPLIRYEKTIHETVNYSLARLGYVPPIKGIYIHHYGYLTDPDRLIKKSVFYRDLLIKQLSITPNDTASWWHLSVSLASLGKIEEAIDAVNHAIKLEPDNKLPYIFLSRFLRIKGKYQEAIEILEVALAKDQGYWAPTIHNLLGLLYMSLNNFEKAINNLEISVKNASYFVHSWVNLGIAYEKTKRWSDALDCYIKAYQLDPELFNISIKDISHPYLFQEDVSELYYGLREHIENCSRSFYL